MASQSAASRHVGHIVLSQGLDEIRGIIFRSLHLLRTAVSRLDLGTVVGWLSSLPLAVLRFVLSICKSITAIPFGIVNLLRYVLDLKVQGSVLRAQPKSIGTGTHAAVSFLSGFFRCDFDFHLQLGFPFRRKASRFLLATDTTPVHTVVLGGVRTVGARGLPIEYSSSVATTSSSSRGTTGSSTSAAAAAAAGAGTTESSTSTAASAAGPSSRPGNRDREHQPTQWQGPLAARSCEMTAMDEHSLLRSRTPGPHTPVTIRTPSPYPVYPQGFTPAPRPHYHIPAEPARWPPASRAWPVQASCSPHSPHCCPETPPRSPTGPLSLPPPLSPPDSTCSLPTISTHRATAFSTPCSSPARSPRTNPLLPAIVTSPGLRSGPAKPVTQGGVSFGLQLLLDAGAGSS